MPVFGPQDRQIKREREDFNFLNWGEINCRSVISEQSSKAVQLGAESARLHS